MWQQTKDNLKMPHNNVVDLHDAQQSGNRKKNAQPTERQRAWLERGLKEAGGKLPLFDASGQRVNERTIRACLDRGWAEHWFANPLKPDWLVCKLTDRGRALFKTA